MEVVFVARWAQVLSCLRIRGSRDDAPFTAKRLSNPQALATGMTAMTTHCVDVFELSKVNADCDVRNAK